MRYQNCNLLGAPEALSKSGPRVTSNGSKPASHEGGRVKAGRGDKERAIRPLESWLLHWKSLRGGPGSSRAPIRGGRDVLSYEGEEYRDRLEEE